MSDFTHPQDNPPVLSEPTTTRDGSSVGATAYTQVILLGNNPSDGVVNTFNLATLATQTTLASVLAAVQVPADLAATLTDGRKTIGTPGTAEAIRGSLACKWVLVTALKTNTDQVNVGGSGALATLGSSTGQPLAAGESVSLPVANANLVFVDARVAGEGVSFTVGS